MFTVRFHCLWVWKGRTDASEWVYSLGRGPRKCKGVGFGVSQSACWIALISAERWGAPAGDEVAEHVYSVFPLPMGTEREDRCE